MTRESILQKEFGVWADVLQLLKKEKPPGCYISETFWGNYFGSAKKIVEGVDGNADHFKRFISDHLNRKDDNYNKICVFLIVSKEGVGEEGKDKHVPGKDVYRTHAAAFVARSQMGVRSCKYNQ